MTNYSEKSFHSGAVADNICCPHLVVLDCADTDSHKHIGCCASLDDSLGLDNNKAMVWCLGDFANCPMRPRGEG